MTMVMNMNMNMVIPAVGRSLNHNQAMSNILYLLCSLRNDDNDNPGNIFLERMKQFMLLELLKNSPSTNIDTLINLSKENNWCRHILKRSDFVPIQQ